MLAETKSQKSAFEQMVCATRLCSRRYRSCMSGARLSGGRLRQKSRRRRWVGKSWAYWARVCAQDFTQSHAGDQEAHPSETVDSLDCLKLRADELGALKSSPLTLEFEEAGCTS